MKKLTLLALLVAGFSLPVHAASISATNLGQLATMPGSTTDYDFLPPGEPAVLDDFTEANGPGMYTWGFPGGGPDYSTIFSPTGASVNTGILFNNGPQPDMVDYTLGTSATFNYSDFNVYFMYGNTFDPGPRNATITLNLLNASSALITTDTVTATDPAGEPQNMAEFEEFTVTGAASGDILQFGATSYVLGGYQSYVGGASFESLPEPSTYALMLGGLALLGFCVRRKALLS
jgi:hypothetical protein